MADFPVSVLDQSPIIGGATPAEAIHSTIALARLADQLGYHRYWLAEHHGLLGLADASPEILLARLGAETQRIRIGTGGIMLPYYASFKVAEQFRMLEALYPGRIDLGLGRAPGGHPRTARVLFDGKPMDSEEGFVRQLMELSAIFKGTVPDGHPLHGEIANPVVPTDAGDVGARVIQRRRVVCGASRACASRSRISSTPIPVPRSAAPIASTSGRVTRTSRISRSP